MGAGPRPETSNKGSVRRDAMSVYMLAWQRNFVKRSSREQKNVSLHVKQNLNDLKKP